MSGNKRIPYYGYDIHMLYGRLLGYTNRIVKDVCDFYSKKQNLKNFEIEFGIHHEELELPLDQSVKEENK